MDQTPEQDLHKENPPAKKVWMEPQIHLISQANVTGGVANGAHEKYFTPNHTHYHIPGGSTPGPFPTSLFNNYIS